MIFLINFQSVEFLIKSKETEKKVDMVTSLVDIPAILQLLLEEF